ncbi:hypothetical protein [Caulobacter sp. AP07]|uniref:hypothetical protein n=1 Tax=Caulobacter sp. AP07 TaxID=1144304 RepID=UPI0012F9B753|nr:hypothetical protein [Caulobacter sp. AP07]
MIPVHEGPVIAREAAEAFSHRIPGGVADDTWHGAGAARGVLEEDAAARASMRGAMDNALGSHLAQDGFHHLSWSTDAVTANEVDCILIAPRNAQDFSVMYGFPPSDAELEMLGKAVGKFESLSMAKKSISASADIISNIKDNDKKILVIVGHNEHGNITLPDGEVVSLKEIEDACAESAKLCIIVSCSSNKFINGKAMGVDKTITLSEAARVVSKVEGVVSKASSEGGTYGDVADALPGMLEKNLNEAHAKVAIRYTVAASVTGGAVYAVSRQDDA